MTTMVRRRCLVHRLFWLLAATGCGLLHGSSGFAESVDFAHEVLPLIRTHCAKCHTDGTYKNGFSLDTRDDLLQSGAVEAGHAADSELLARVTSEDPDYRMPPEGEPLTRDQQQLLRRWIDEGLSWEPGFSFRQQSYQAPLRPRRPELPPGDGHPVDRLMDAYLRDRGQPPLQPVDDGTFLRRVSLDLVGLLPEAGELQNFLSDPASDKRSQKVDELLARNVDYADHWLTFWNDLLRNDYSGTGYIDGGRQQITAWLYRALYDNLPFDQFAQQLIAPASDSIGFANGIQWRGNVNASQVRELQYAQNVAQVFLGENLKCASCHDSFINNWKLTDAYGLAAVVAEQPLEIHRCDQPTGQFAKPSFLWPELIAEMRPAVAPQASESADTSSTGLQSDDKATRMQATAELVTMPENGRFTRTIVNRLWQRLMGQGLVEPVDVMGNRPWSEDMLDFLAVDLADHGYDIRYTLRQIATSRAYQAASAADDSKPTAESFVFRGPTARRLTAEQFLDAVWRLTNSGPQEMIAEIGVDRGGPAKSAASLRSDPTSHASQTAADSSTDQATATVTLRPVRASLVNADLLMRMLGRPNREQVVSTRPDELSTLQALYLSNDEQLFAELQTGASRWVEAYPEPDTRLEALYTQALCRSPTQRERDAILPAFDEADAAPAVEQDLTADVMWMIVMLPEFQYVR